MERIVIGLSGGVDSSVAAYLLKQQGYEVVGVYMINWKDTIGTLSGDCPYEDDLLVAELVARKLGIEFHSVDLSDQYRDRVVEYMFSEYEKGRTPNPDVLCNREIKFDVFLKAAELFGAQRVATGHYVRSQALNDGSGLYRLMAGVDPNKDQSYFLCQLTQKQLSRSLFPIGEIEKPEVRRIATELGLATAQKKDSQGICFVGRVDLPVFLQQKLARKQGKVVEIPSDLKAYHRMMPDVFEDRLRKLAKPYFYRLKEGKVVGEHNGAHFYTVGQRKGLGIGGHSEPLFVLATDVQENIIYVGQGDQHPGLYRSALKIENSEVHWVRPDMCLEVGGSLRAQVRIRYRQPLQDAVLHQLEDGLYVLFDRPQQSITSGQFAVWYLEDEVIGSGAIA
ncbi:MAG: tRNA 2-thiouridine(34) synthase MnmA [Bacteroidales bacterium]|nr:tRNA 2-thiouridine(34) synthase MnmA [Bacteroidales bacterium]HKL93166.1 tRNA 2-thiouridine(34) synthase MnmA [Bacteroidales bacterium]